MTVDTVQLDKPPIGQGMERTCYPHPEDARKVIKVSEGETDIQTRREVSFYRILNRRNNVPYTHIPQYHGPVKTNRGVGHIYDLICDADGGVSESLLSCFKRGNRLTEYASRLADLKTYFLDHLIVFGGDVEPGNILVQRMWTGQSRLVVIDGIGDGVLIPWLNKISSHVRKKIHRRWDRSMRLSARIAEEANNAVAKNASRMHSSPPPARTFRANHLPFFRPTMGRSTCDVVET